MLETRICDSCQNAAYDETGGPGEETELYVEICLLLGADIPDHLCDETESDGNVRCDCPCHRTRFREREKRVWTHDGCDASHRTPEGAEVCASKSGVDSAI